MEKKQYLSFLAIIVVVAFVIIFLRDPVSENNIIEDTEKENESETELVNVRDGGNEIDPIEYINLQGENRELKKQIEILEDEFFVSNFELAKIIMNSELINEVLPYPESSEILFKEVEDTYYEFFYRDETGYNLIVSSLEERSTEHFNFYQLDPTEDFNWFGGDSTYNGFIADSQIQSVRVIQNETVYDAEIITINENLRVWYSIIEFERKSLSEEPDKMKIEALNEEGEVIWQESFEGNLGG
ncbi:hypothetical protein ACM26V_04665 [Salipaludibacillus sp. HK11]|uniref:hypothetical protein n=1 Tax=Salipaludibacillus sp. HK11 TaxID=3394320 RepID=UPI0039FCB468